MSRTIGQHVHAIRAAASHGSLSIDLSRDLDLAACELGRISGEDEQRRSDFGDGTWHEVVEERDALRKMAKEVRRLANEMSENPTLGPAGALIGRLLTKHGVTK